MTLVGLVLLAACELEPPPKQPPSTQTQTAPGPKVPSVPIDAAAGAPELDAGGAQAVAVAQDVSAACSAIAVHVASTLIENARDPAAKALMDQERPRIVRKTAEACTNDKWSDETLACFTKATTVDEMQICGQNLAPPSDD